MGKSCSVRTAWKRTVARLAALSSIPVSALKMVGRVRIRVISPEQATAPAPSGLM